MRKLTVAFCRHEFTDPCHGSRLRRLGIPVQARSDERVFCVPSRLVKSNANDRLVLRLSSL
jgi:hypothetical protein